MCQDYVYVKLEYWRCRIWLNTFRPRQNGRNFTYDIFKCFFMNEFRLQFHSSLFLSVQLTVFQHWFKPLSEPKLVRSPVYQPQWVYYLVFIRLHASVKPKPIPDLSFEEIPREVIFCIMISLQSHCNDMLHTYVLHAYAKENQKMITHGK